MKANREVFGEMSVISLPVLTAHKRKLRLNATDVKDSVARGETAVLMTDVVSQMRLIGEYMCNRQMQPCVFALDEGESFFAWFAGLSIRF